MAPLLCCLICLTSNQCDDSSPLTNPRPTDESIKAVLAAFNERTGFKCSQDSATVDQPVDTPMDDATASASSKSLSKTKKPPSPLKVSKKPKVKAKGKAKDAKPK